MFCIAKQSSLLKTHLRRQIFQATKLAHTISNQEESSASSNNKTPSPSFSGARGAHLHAHCRHMATASGSGKARGKGEPNRLALEKSPYLLQHAHNPVDWFPWGQEAFSKAKKEKKPIFLSVGYSTCHWCHVMERESFESEEVAKVLNEHYIAVKVDREERPDVDRIYMSFVQRTTGSGGWPMSVFLTPALEPLYGGTYFPPKDMYGRVGFKHLLEIIAKQWREEHKTLELEAKEGMLQIQLAVRKKLVQGSVVPNEASWEKCYEQMARSYEEKFGGFSQAPKFPQPSMFNFLFHLYSKDKKSFEGKRALHMCLHTLKKMAQGGLHDHVNCGFARYSVDGCWQVPHFEKMLYDQAQLAVSYVDAYVVSKDMFYAEIVDDILEYVGRDLNHPEGGFYGAEDADSYPKDGDTKKMEGAFCVWEYQELKALLTGESNSISHFELYAHHFDVQTKGNVPVQYDGHGELTGKNILSCMGSVEDTAANYGLTVEQTKEILRLCHQILYQQRQLRPKPSVDDKIVTSWNGLMISGFAKAGFALKKQAYTDRAVKAATFIRTHLYRDKKLLRCCYGSQNAINYLNEPIRGFVDDYAFLIRGLLDLYEATMDGSWLQWAEELQKEQDRQFWDEDGHGYFTSSAGDTHIIVRDKEDQDGAEPCANSVSTHNLLRLAGYLNRKDLHVKASQILAAYSERLLQVPIALPEMTSALMFYRSEPTQVFIVGGADDGHTQALLDVVRASFLPGRILAVADGPEGRAGILYSRNESLARLKPVKGQSAAYVCRNFACSLPVTDPKELAKSLAADSKKPRRHTDDSDSDSD